MDNHSPKTLMEAIQHFSDEDVCHEYVKRIKWPDGEVVCPGCGCANVGWIKSRRLFQCREKECRTQFSVKVGTIFEDSALALSKWLVAVWCIVNARNGISSYELHRTIGITQKSAWHMLHRVRVAMRTPTYRQITGEIETDETMFGGKLKHMRRAKRQQIKAKFGPAGINKTVIQGLLERGGELRAHVVKDNKARTIQPGIRLNVEPGSTLFTDIGSWYRGLMPEYLMEQVNHLAHQYVSGRIHVNTLEGFWSLLKRTVNGTYVAIAPKHLGRYLDEYCRRFNIRDKGEFERFQDVMRTIVGRRLRYRQLTG